VNLLSLYCRENSSFQHNHFSGGLPSELVSRYLFEDRCGRPGKGNDKGKVEGMVEYTRCNFMVHKPRFASFDDLNTHLAEQYRRCVGDKLHYQKGQIDERFKCDVEWL